MNNPTPEARAPRIFGLAAALLATLSFTLISACAPKYEYKPIPVRDISQYPGHASAEGVTAGALAYYDSKELSGLFGFDLKKAGVIPVQVRIRNTGSHPLTVAPGSTETDEAGLTWEVLPSSVVFDRIDSYTSGSLSMDEGAKRTLLWGLAGAVVGAAVGVAAGSNVGEAAGKGAALGAGAGAATAIAGVGAEDTSGAVSRDFSARSIDSMAIQPGAEAYGFLYFPAESQRPRTLHLNTESGGSYKTIDIGL
jgi:hypothetical protein